MSEVIAQVIDYMRTNAVSFSFNGESYSFTWFELCISILVIEIGIFVVEKIMGD